ncbi:TraR/DksA family transcriptional regulator [Paraliomyxa miuraensis]|uniref:TraR/DksA family transcriptional regulator n=1 Tax=Paraliomyxa miuraensis TaxID=376150 RepID=UPI00224F22CD|nr:TraR/DksA family transcriptional regulator [Paraliomyxa miuraensis]MCX4247293.1 TraR/DksA family transcriptional regulator [Paraliomyxa miuraensis]
MQHLHAAQLAELRQLLETERQRLWERQDADEAEAVTADVEPGDVQDRASEEARRLTALRRRKIDEDRLREVDAALQRMDDGTYGVCEETDEEIPFARLRAEPTTRFTVEAQQMLEEERARESLAGATTSETDAY